MSPLWPTPDAVRIAREQAALERARAKRREVYQRHPREVFARRVAEEEAFRRSTDAGGFERPGSQLDLLTPRDPSEILHETNRIR